MDKQIDQVIRRTKSYMYVDGTFELRLGITLILYSIFSFILDNPFHWKLSGYIFFIISFILIAGGFTLTDSVIRFIKERYTYRRSGMAIPPRRKEPLFPADTMFFLAILGFLALIVFTSMVGELIPDRWMPILVGLILSMVLFSAGLRSGLRRYILLAFVCLLVSFIMAWGYVGDGYTIELTLAVIGVIVLLDGVYIFLNYLKNTPLPGEADHGQ